MYNTQTRETQQRPAGPRPAGPRPAGDGTEKGYGLTGTYNASTQSLTRQLG